MNKESFIEKNAGGIDARFKLNLFPYAFVELILFDHSNCNPVVGIGFPSGSNNIAFSFILPVLSRKQPGRLIFFISTVCTFCK